MRQSLAGWQGAGSTLLIPYFNALLAEGYWQTGQVELGIQVIDQGLHILNSTGERTHEAELYRLRGEMMRSQDHDEAEIEHQFQQALAIAREQEAKSLELRATMSLSRLWQQQGRRAEAYEQLSKIYGWFTEGFNTADLRETHAILKELR